MRKIRRRRNKQRKIIIFSLIAIMFIMSAGYAVMQTTLEIKAKGNIVDKGMTVEDFLNSIPKVTEGDGLYADINESGRYVYKGSVNGTNNYIQFNNELWRIVSIETDGTIKILRNAVLTDRVWDTIVGLNYSSHWERPADLNTYLNGEYYNSLNVTAQGQIANHIWGVGAVTYNDSSLSNAIADENETIWTGNVGLISTTDYVRASTNALCTSVYAYYNSSSCYNNSTNHNWMYLSDYWWTITPSAPVRPESYSSRVFSVHSDGDFSRNDFDSSYAPRPAVYLSPNVKGELEQR